MIKLFILGILILAGNPAWGDVTAWVNKNPVMVGDMFQLHVEAKNVDDAEEPDLSGITGEVCKIKPPSLGLLSQEL